MWNYRYTYLLHLFFDSDIFWHVRSKTTQSLELKYRLHREIMCVLLLYFSSTMSSFSTSSSGHDCMLEWCFYKTVCLNSNIIFPTSESYFRAYEFVCKARCVLPWASLDTGTSSVIYHQVIQHLVIRSGPFSNEFHLIQSTAKTT